MRRFINGPLKGTKLEIMSSKPAVRLLSGAPITEYNYDETELTPTQVSHKLNNLDVHEPQRYTISEKNKVTHYIGPSVAQEWKLLYQGKRPFYQVESTSSVEGVI